MSDLVYDLESRPPFWVLLGLGLQHVGLFAISLVFPVVLVRKIGGNMDQAAFMVSMSMAGAAVGVIVQSLKRGPVGSGYLCPQVCGPSFISASLHAGMTGGLPLVLGMTMFAGVAEGFFSRLVRKLRMFFPPEVTGLIVTMVGVTVVHLAATNLFGLEGSGDGPKWESMLTAFITLGVMIGLNVWSKGKFKLFCAVIGMAVGYGAAAVFGVLGSQEYTTVSSEPWLAFPLLHHPGWAFDVHMILPFLIAMLCSSLKSIGDLSTCQKINDPNWKRPDMENASKGILADAVGCMSSGFLGGFAQSTSSTNIGLSIATGATSRMIAYAMGGVLLFLAFCPKLSSVFAIMPPPVIGATLVFALSFMVVAGFQIIMSRMMDNRKIFVVGISLITGLMVDITPEAFAGLPEAIKPVFSSSLSAATVIAVILNMIFRIGIAKHVSVTLDAEQRPSLVLPDWFSKQGKAWGARPEVINQAAIASVEIIESVLPDHQKGKSVDLKATFDEYSLALDMEYEGSPVNLPHTPASAEQICESLGDEEICLSEPALMMALLSVKKVHQSSKGERRKLTLVYEH